MIQINRDTVLTTEVIRKLVTAHKQKELPRLMKLEDYYNGKSTILNRLMADAAKPNNKIAHPFPQYITDTLTGYFMGVPVSYSATEQDDALEELKLIFAYNDEQDENAEIAKDTSIFGVAYEMLYTDEEGAIRFVRVNPKEIIPVYDDSIDEELLYVIRYYSTVDIATDEEVGNIEIYSASNVVKYRASAAFDNMTVIGELPHYFSKVPFVVYKNNESLLGDFENVISIIDAYDKLESDSLNDFEYFCDAYLALYGFMADAEDVRAMKENRVLLMDSGTSAEWLTKSTSDTQIENIKTRLENDIHKFAKCPNFSDENFASNASGVAMKYKVMGTENVVAIKERKFKKGLQKRIALIAAILELKSTSLDWRGIEITFSRSLPSNLVEIADVISKLAGVVSTETLLSQIPFIEDVSKELERLADDNETNAFYTMPLAEEVAPVVGE